MADRHIAHSRFNVLNLDDPDAYSGRIELYTPTQQQLMLNFFSQTDELSPLFMIQFEMVHYIDWPSRWHGANIHTASEAECWDLLRQILGPSVAQPDPAVKHTLLDEFRLYTITVRQITYRIIATQVISLVAPSH